MAPVAGLGVAAAAFALAAIVGWQPRPGVFWWLAAGAAATAVHVAMAARDHLRTAAQLDGARDELRHGVAFDRLTGLPGSGTLLRTLRSPTSTIAEVAAVEIGRLEILRDTWGLDHADALEIEVAERLVEVTGAEAQVAHVGPGRFVVARAATEAPAGWAEALHRTVDRPVRLGSIDATPGARLGVAAIADLAGSPLDPGQRAEELVAAAHLALRAAGGVQPVVRYEPSLRTAAEHRVALAGELQQARADGELEVYFQPITRLADGRITGAEALLRWHHPRRGTVDAREWVRVAEEIGLLPEVGRATLAESCRHFAALAARRPDDPLTVSVNLSRAELATAGLVDHVASCLAASGLAPRLLAIEVDEAGLAAAADTVDELRRLGVRVAVDDLGAGAGSLADLRRTDVDQLKIDGSLVAELPDRAAIGIVDAIVTVAGALRLEVVAEGVGTEGQAEVLRRAGVDLAQGYLYGRALPFTRFVSAVERIDRARAGSEGAGSAGTMPTLSPDEAPDTVAELG